MTNRVVSGGQQAAPMMHGGKSDLDQPAWLGSTVLATAITAFITCPISLMEDAPVS